MKTKTFILLVAISLFTVSIDAQIKIHSGNGISVGSTVNPGNNIISLDNPAVFSQGLSTETFNLPDLELTTSTDWLNQTDLLYDFPSGYLQIECTLGSIEFSTNHSVFDFNEKLRVESTYYYSDTTLKENVTKIKDRGSSMEIITKLEGIKYNLKDDKDKINYTGFSAQDLQKVLPDIVLEDDDGVLAVNYTGLIPYLVEALKEQETSINTLESRITNLERMLVEMDKLETLK